MGSSLLADFSDASFQRAFMYISGPYPMKALHTQGVRIPISSSVGIGSVEIPSPGASAMAPAQWLAGLPLEQGENLCQQGPTPLLPLHLCQRCLRLGQPEGHLHGTVQLHGRGQCSAGLLPLADGNNIQRAEAE